MITRATFLKNLFTVSIGSALPKKLLSYKKVYLLHCFVAGFQYYEGEDLLPGMHEGDLLELRREPGNQADRRAIAVYYNGSKIGFVPRRENKMLSKLIDADAMPLVAEITHLKSEAPAWEQVYIAVSMLKEQYAAFAPHAAYLTVIKEPDYKRRPKDTSKPKDWYDILLKESKTDHFYDLWYSNGPYPNLPHPNHNGDFIVIRKSRMPAYFRDSYERNVTETCVDIEPPYGNRDYMLMKTGRLGNYLEAAKSIREVFDKNGNNYLELNF